MLVRLFLFCSPGDLALRDRGGPSLVTVDSVDETKSRKSERQKSTAGDRNQAPITEEPEKTNLSDGGNNAEKAGESITSHGDKY